MPDWKVIEGDCVEAMAAMPEASVDAVVCDPPYGLEFMGREWDKLDGSNGFRRGDNPADVGRDNVFGRASARGPEYIAGRRMQEWHEAWAREALRVLKPGGHLLAFGGTRTYHRLACAIEDAGFEIRDTIAWMYGSGFPKSLDVSKAIDNAAGAEREVVGQRTDGVGNTAASLHKTDGFAASREAVFDVTAPATPAAEHWQGWGTALAPAHEPIVVARKPLAGTVAANVLKFGTGALNIDGSRIASARSTSRLEGCPSSASAPHAELVSAWLPVDLPEAKAPTALTLAATLPEGDPVLLIRTGEEDGLSVRMAMSLSAWETTTTSSIASSWRAWLADRSNGGNTSITATVTGLTTDPRTLSCCRWLTTQRITTPDASLSDGCECDAWPVVETSSAGEWRWSDTRLRIAPASATAAGRWPKNVLLDEVAASLLDAQRPGEEPPSRFFMVPKASSAERNAGLDGFEAKPRPNDSAWIPRCEKCGGHLTADQRDVTPCCGAGVAWDRPSPTQNVHPTVKPIDLMRWLVRLVTPPGGLVLDPFTGSGTTGCAAVLEGFRFVGIEREPEYAAIARARIAWWAEHPDGMEFVQRLEAEKQRKAVADAGQLGLFG